MLGNCSKILFLIVCLFPFQAHALTQTMTARIAFATPVSVTQNSDGNITVAGAEDQTVDISVDDHGSSALHGATCSYDGGDAGPCSIADAAAPGRGKNLQLAGATASTLTVSVVYQ